jgi:SagB-type dehydrogenase family enzyme
LDLVDQKRLFMQSGFYTTPVESDQIKGVQQPPFEKPADPSAPVFDLPKPDPKVIKKSDVFACMADRRSRRKFTGEPLSVDELAFLLWATQGVREVIPGRTFRTVPSAGARHPYETYLAVFNVGGLEPGIYRYLALTHKLILVARVPDIASRMVDISGGIKWLGDASVTFIWAATAYRNQWRYQREGPRVMLIDVGHICQNLYTGVEALGYGTCGIGAYKQAEIDRLLGLDGNEEYVVYYAPVGRI